ncbi:MAG: RNA polymerase sigma factor [Actinomycetes bacterium]
MPIRSVEDLRPEVTAQILGRLVRHYGADQLDACEDAVQEALLDAHKQWTDGTPDDPVAWLVTAARRRYVDLVRSEVRRRGREEHHARLAHPLADAVTTHTDDSVRLLELCCHPDLPRPMQVALTLRAVAGLTTEQIASAYQLPVATIAQRITRAKRRLQDLSTTLPQPRSPTERLDPVLTVLYVMFTEAHHTASGEPAHDVDLAAEAIRLTRMVHGTVGDDTEATGMLALLLLTEARQPARISPAGGLIPLDEQDRTRWDARKITEGVALVEAAAPGAKPGPYLLQACIAALHAQAPCTSETDWREILVLYRMLEQVTPNNPAVTLNRAVVEAMVFGPEVALRTVNDVADRMPRSAQLPAVTARLHELHGDTERAAEAYREALRRTRSTAERRLFTTRLRMLRTHG